MNAFNSNLHTFFEKIPKINFSDILSTVKNSFLETFSEEIHLNIVDRIKTLSLTIRIGLHCKAIFSFSSKYLSYIILFLSVLLLVLFLFGKKMKTPIYQKSVSMLKNLIVYLSIILLAFFILNSILIQFLPSQNTGMYEVINPYKNDLLNLKSRKFFTIVFASNFSLYLTFLNIVSLATGLAVFFNIENKVKFLSNHLQINIFMFLGSCVLYAISAIESLKLFKSDKIIFYIIFTIFIIVNFLLFAAKMIYKLTSKRDLGESKEDLGESKEDLGESKEN